MVLSPAESERKGERIMDNEQKKRLQKELREMNVIDNFLFSEIMADEKRGKEACRLILSRVLNREIGDIEFTPEKIVPGVSEKNHGIRMDAYITEHTGDVEKGKDTIRIFDIEPDKNEDKKSMLPRRSRYYTDLIDVQLLETSTEYDKLPEMISIFILSYDPFGMNEMVYEVGNMIKTHPEISYNDGIRRIFLYVDGELSKGAGESEKKLQSLLRYIGKSKEENITDKEIEELDDIVKQVKSKKDVGVRYMKSWEWEKEIREEEQKKTEAERQRADKAEAEANKMKAELAKYKAKYGDIA